MDDLTSRSLSLQNQRISTASQNLKQRLMTYGQLGNLNAREEAFKSIVTLRSALDEVERLLNVPRYPGDTFEKKG